MTSFALARSRRQQQPAQCASLQRLPHETATASQDFAFSLQRRAWHARALTGAKRLDRHFFKDFNAFSVSNYFGFEPRVDEELQPGITISKPVRAGREHACIVLISMGGCWLIE